VITKKKVVHMAGGTSFYFSNAISNMKLKYLLITSVAEKEMHFVSDMRRDGIEVQVTGLSPHTVYFENNYAEDQDHRTQRVIQKSDPFKVTDFHHANASFFHLGPLLADDIPEEVIKLLSEKGIVSLDVQGYLRKVENQKVYPIDWPGKKEILQYVSILKANEFEMEILTGSSDVKKSARILFDWGVREIVITLGSRGSVIYDGTRFYHVPAYNPVISVVDATGCGDTYMAGYLFQRFKGIGCQKAGEFAAAMATAKIESSGPFKGKEEDITAFLTNAKERAVFGI
jgi:sugar/nucleoside kinase (ribokinase family)